MSGYDIKKHVKSMLSAVTNASYGTLYPTLHKLRDEQAVDMREIPQKGRPSKKVYRITQKGRDDLVNWLKEPAAADQIKREFLLKLYLAKNLPPKHLKTMVAARRDEVEALRRTLKAEKDEVSSPWQVWIVEYTLSLCEAEIHWLKQLEAEIGVA